MTDNLNSLALHGGKSIFEKSYIVKTTLIPQFPYHLIPNPIRTLVTGCCSNFVLIQPSRKLQHRRPYDGREIDFTLMPIASRR